MLLLGGEQVLALHAARASAAHFCVQLPQLPPGIAFSRLHFSPADGYLLLLPGAMTERARLPEDAEAVTLCVADMQQDALITWQVHPGRCSTWWSYRSLQLSQLAAVAVLRLGLLWGTSSLAVTGELLWPWQHRLS